MPQTQFIDGVIIIPVGTLRQVPTGSRTENSGSALALVHRQRVGYSSYATDTSTYCTTCTGVLTSAVFGVLVYTPVVGL